MQTLSIIIPFLNEENTIKILLEKVILVNNLLYQKEIILVNDGSSDASEDIIFDIIKHEHENTSFIYLKNPKNCGKGYACKIGIERASGDFFIIQDADLEYHPNDFQKMLSVLETGKYDFLYGSRNRGFLENGFSYSYVSFLLGGLLISLMTSILSGKIVTDEPTCYKLFRSHLKELLLTPPENGFEWEPAITILLLKKKFAYGETGIQYFPRKTTEGKKIKWIDGIKALMTLIKWRFN